VRFLIDTQLPRALVPLLRGLNHEVDHVLDLEMAQSPDNELWHYAKEHESIIVTKDEDFADWVSAGRPGPAIVWLRIGNCTNPELMDWLLPSWPRIVENLENGDRLVEVV